MLSSNRTWFSLKIADSVQQSGKKRGFSRQILSTAPRYLTTYSNIESTQMFILFLCIILCIFWCHLAAKKLTPQILNYRISVGRIVTDEQFTSASILNLIDTNPHPPGSTLATFQWGAASLLWGTSTSFASSTSPRLAPGRCRRIIHKVASSPQRQIMSSITTYRR